MLFWGHRPTAPGTPSGTAESATEAPMTLEAKWIGPCREGQRPGDIIMPGGIKLNIRSLTIGSGPGLGR